MRPHLEAPSIVSDGSVPTAIPGRNATMQGEKQNAWAIACGPVITPAGAAARSLASDCKYHHHAAAIPWHGASGWLGRCPG